MTQVDSKVYAALLAPFRLDSLQQTDAPAGCDGVWQRYVITQGANTIVGMRCGSQADVNHVVNDYIGRLNLRFAKQQGKPMSERSIKKVGHRL